MNGLGKNRTWAGVLGLPQNPDFSGFASRFFWKHVLPGLADWHVGETVSFPDLLIRMSGKPPASRTCRFACQGNRQLPGLADSHVRETVSFPDLLIRMSGGRRRCFKSIRAGRNIRDLNGSVPVHPSVQNYWGSSCLGILVSRSNKSPPMRADKIAGSESE